MVVLRSLFMSNMINAPKKKNRKGGSQTKRQIIMEPFW